MHLRMQVSFSLLLKKGKYCSIDGEKPRFGAFIQTTTMHQRQFRMPLAINLQQIWNVHIRWYSPLT